MFYGNNNCWIWIILILIIFSCGGCTIGGNNGCTCTPTCTCNTGCTNTCGCV